MSTHLARTRRPPAAAYSTEEDIGSRAPGRAAARLAALGDLMRMSA